MWLSLNVSSGMLVLLCFVLFLSLCVCVCNFRGSTLEKCKHFQWWQCWWFMSHFQLHEKYHVGDFSRIVFTPKCTYFYVKAVSDFELVEKLNHPVDSQFEDGKNGRKSFKVQVILWAQLFQRMECCGLWSSFLNIVPCWTRVMGKVEAHLLDATFFQPNALGAHCPNKNLYIFVKWRNVSRLKSFVSMF